MHILLVMHACGFRWGDGGGGGSGDEYSGALTSDASTNLPPVRSINKHMSDFH